MPSRFHIGKDVCPAKTVYGLFGIAYQKEYAPLIGKALFEYLILNRVCVLEFIDQRGRKFCAGRPCKPLSTLCFQCPVQIQQKVVKKKDVFSIFFSIELFLHIIEHLLFQTAEILLKDLFQFLVLFVQSLTKIKEQVCRGDVILFYSVFDDVRREFLECIKQKRVVIS